MASQLRAHTVLAEDHSSVPSTTSSSSQMPALQLQRAHASPTSLGPDTGTQTFMLKIHKLPHVNVFQGKQSRVPSEPRAPSFFSMSPDEAAGLRDATLPREHALFLMAVRDAFLALSGTGTGISWIHTTLCTPPLPTSQPAVLPYALLPNFTRLTHYCHQTILGLSNERGLKTVAPNVFHPPLQCLENLPFLSSWSPVFYPCLSLPLSCCFPRPP